MVNSLTKNLFHAIYFSHAKPNRKTQKAPHSLTCSQEEFAFDRGNSSRGRDAIRVLWSAQWLCSKHGSLLPLFSAVSTQNLLQALWWKVTLVGWSTTLLLQREALKGADNLYIARTVRRTLSLHCYLHHLMERSALQATTISQSHIPPTL